ncbi:DUF6603 domain-containing protein [Nocardia sp. NPDC001965]
MTLDVTDLCALFPAEGGQFTIAATELGIDPVADLFTGHLGEPRLVVADASADSDTLMVTGSVVTTAYGERPAWIRFDTDERRELVLGFELAISVPGFEIDSGALELSLGFLEQGYGLAGVHLVLAAIPENDVDPATPPAVGAGVGVELEKFGSTIYLSGLAPALGDTFSVSGIFDPIGLSDLQAIAEFAPGLPGSEFTLPQEFSDLAGDPRLSCLALDFDPYLPKIVGGYAEVLLAGTWQLAPELFELSDITVGFGVAGPAAADGLVRATLGATLALAESSVAVWISLPGGEVSGSLTEPLPLAVVAEKYFGATGLPADLLITDLTLSTDTAAPATSYELRLGLAGSWELPGGIALTGLGIALRAEGTAKTAELWAGLGIGDTGEVLLSAVRDTGGTWIFGGAATALTLEDVLSTFGVPGLPDSVSGLAMAELTVQYDTGTKRFDLTASLELPLGDAAATLDLGIALTPAPAPGTGYDKNLSAALRLELPSDTEVPRLMEFVVTLDESSWLVASWEDSDGLSAADIAEVVGIDLSSLPAALLPTLYGLTLVYNSVDKSQMLAARTELTGWALYSLTRGTGQPALTAVTARGYIAVKASGLPMVGEAIPAGMDVEFRAVQFAHVKQEWLPADIAKAAALARRADPDNSLDLPVLLTAGHGTGLTVWVDLVVDGAAVDPVVLPVGAGNSGAAVASTVAPQEPRRELDLVFGPVRFNRLTLGYADGGALIALDVTLTVGPAELVLRGLGLIITPDFTVTPQLAGAGLLVRRPPLMISGSLERRLDPAFSTLVVGMATAESSFFALQAVGAYARSTEGWASIFVFGEAAGPAGVALFGPPAFSVSGLSAGFGVNSSVRVPEMSELPQFPLLGRLSSAEPAPSPQEMLETLMGSGGWVRARSGQYWGAVGVRFTSFRFIDAQALALVEFGQSLTVMLLARTAITLPRNAAPGARIHAYLGIDLRLAYRSALGLLSLDAAIAPGSFIFDPGVQLHGGLSIYLWTGGPHQGDFVYSLGGYHPSFREPRHYPHPERVGFSWAPDDRLMIRAQGYTATTPSAFMVGGRLDATYDAGLLSAWFSAYLDALIQWKPFYVDLRLGVRIGVAATVKIAFVKVRVSIEVGIDLAIWTPPFGGRVEVKVWFISFGFDIGSGRQSPPGIPWTEFRGQLPEPLTIAPLAGLMVDVDPAELAARAERAAPTLVSADGFVFVSEAVVPATHLFVNDIQTASTTEPVHIRPMRLEGVISEHRVTIRRNQSEDYYDIEGNGWQLTTVRAAAATALWGAPLHNPDQALDESMLPDRLAGVRFSVGAPVLGIGTGGVTGAALSVEQLDDGVLPDVSGTSGPVPAAAPDSIPTITSTIADPDTATRRDEVYAALCALGLAPGANGSRERYAARAADLLTDPPMTVTA